MLYSDSCIHMTEENIFFDYLSNFTGGRSVNIYHVTGVYSVSKYPSIGCFVHVKTIVNSMESRILSSDKWMQDFSFIITTQINFCLHYSKTWKRTNRIPMILSPTVLLSLHNEMCDNWRNMQQMYSVDIK